jgi:phosphoesterase RecJ-like protein
MKRLAELKELLDSPKKITIIPHRKPDADALGSCLGLSHFLRKKGHETWVISPTDYPKFLHWMPGQEETIIFNDQNEIKSFELFKDSDLIFCLDFSGLGRVDVMEATLRNVVEKKYAQVVMIDHHLGKEDFADFEMWDTNSPATAQLTFDFIELLGDKNKIDLDIAACLYAGILADTGSFKYPSTNSRTHEIAAELMGIGLEPSYIHREMFDNNSINRIKFLGFALNERLTIMPEYKTAYFAISKKDLENFDSRTGDTEGIVNFALSIEGISFAIFFSQADYKVKISFRSVGDFAVNEFASEHFKGGGHKNAAGGQMNGNLKKALDKFHEVLPNYKEQLLKVE